MSDVTVRHADSGDADSIVSIIRESFDPWVMARSPYGCAGALAYVERLIGSAPVSDTRYLVADAGTGVVGCAAVRMLDASLLISYLAVSPVARGKGIGRTLVRDASGLSGDRDRVLVDVFDGNRAIGLYARLGFTLEGSMGWWERALPVTTAGSPAPVLGLAEADAVQASYGFSQITVRGQNGEHVVGRLGDTWWRIRGSDLLGDIAAVRSLRWIDPRRQVLSIGALGDPTMGAWGPPARTARRLGADIDTVRQAIATD